MEKVNQIEPPKSSPAWEHLEEHLRIRLQGWVQDLLEEEVTSLLGREKHERNGSSMDGPVGYRNGYGKPRGLATPAGTIKVRRPRVRGLEERFESRILPLFRVQVSPLIRPDIGC